MKTLLPVFSAYVLSGLLLIYSAGYINLFHFKHSKAYEVNAKVCIAYPRAKEDKRFYIFFNTRNIGDINYGERSVYTLSSAGMLKVTISKDNSYKEPSTLSKTSRMINVEQGKEYYFEINSKGELEYIINSEKGKNRFLNDGSYSGAPQTFAENISDTTKQN